MPVFRAIRFSTDLAISRIFGLELLGNLHNLGARAIAWYN